MQTIKTRDKSKKRAAILEGAIDVFIEMGYELASMDKIAETAGVSKRTVYNHFESKETLFQVVVNQFLQERQYLKTIEYDSEKSLESQLLRFIEAEVFLIDSSRRLGLSRFLTITFLKDTSYARETVSKYPPTTSMFMVWLEHAQADGRIKADNLMLAAQLFYALIVGGITWPVLFTDHIDKVMIKPMVDEVIETFMARYGMKDK